MQADKYLRIVKLSAWYDLFVTSVFATPWTFSFFYHKLQLLSVAWHLPGSISNPDATSVLFANLLGTIVVVWSLVRLSRPLVRYGRFDAAGRAFFALWQIYAVYSGIGAILLVFTVFEVLFGILQALPVKNGIATTAAAH